MAENVKTDVPRPRARAKWIGTRPIRPDGVDKVTGRARFGADFSCRACWSARCCAARTPHARIRRSTPRRPRRCPASRRWSPATTSPTSPRSSCRPARCWSTTGTWCATSWRARRRSTRATRWPRWPRPAPRIAEEALKLIEVEYEVLPHVIDVVEAMKPDAPLLHDDMFTAASSPRPTSPRTSPSASSSSWATSRPASRRPTSSSSASSRPRPCTRATSSRTPAWPASPRTARRAVVLDPGPLHRARPLRQAARHGHRQAARHRLRDRRRLRRQDRGLSRAAGARAVAQGAAAGEDGDDARGGVQAPPARPPAPTSR